jgi:acyl-CoA thioesterase-1
MSVFLPTLIALTSLTAPAPKPQRTLVFLGDSLTAGLGLTREEAFPSQVEARIRTLGMNWRVINAGVTGDTSAGAKARLDFIYQQKPDVIFLCIGSNDGLRGLPVAEIERNLRQILERARKSGTQVVLAGALLPENYGNDYRTAFAALFPRLAKAYKLPFLPFLLEGVAMRPEFNQEDGIHPNPEGARRVAWSVWKVLEPELKKLK